MRWVALLVALALLVFVAFAWVVFTITMSGSSVLEVVVVDLVYFYRHAVWWSSCFLLVGGGMGMGIVDVARGIVDVGLVSCNFGLGDLFGFVFTPFALSGVCLVINKENLVLNMIWVEIQGIVFGSITSWTQILGFLCTDAIVLSTLDLIAGVCAVFESVFVDVIMLELFNLRTFVMVVQIRDFVEQTFVVWGYVDFALIALVHRMTYEGVFCICIMIRLGIYLAQRLFGVVICGCLHAALVCFLHWVVISCWVRHVILSRYVFRVL